MSAKTVHPATILAEADRLAERLTKLPDINIDTPDSFTTHREAVAELVAELMAREAARPTTCRANWQGGVFALYGFRATSTSGLPGAIQNWITQVRQKGGEK
ncbi:MAG: hypothetical protein CML69_00915 [Rhodobacteraceae bacterium]|nr:hypothetical protein [Paracoccaceae bacterium]